MANIIDAIINLIKHQNFHVIDKFSSSNRINILGDSFEKYVQDLFANTFNDNEIVRQEKIQKVFSYIGNSSNPPDAMLLNGDAIEIKKIQQDNSDLAFNSSTPKDKLTCDNELLTRACIKSEKWEIKDILYIVGVVKNKKLNHLSMVYGEDYCANQDVYVDIKEKIKNGINNIDKIQFSKTKELGRVNQVDPLGITYMRIRGMWGIANPWKVFEYIYKRDFNKSFNFMCIININKWDSLKNKNQLLELENNIQELKIIDTKIKDPNNLSKLKNAKLITYSK